MKRTKGQLEIVKYRKLQWLNIIDVEEEHLAHLGKKFKFHHLDLEDCMSETQRPKIDEYDKYLFIVLHLPVYDKRRKEVKMIEVDMFVGNNFFVTVHDGHKELNKIFKECNEKLRTKKGYMSKGSGYLLYKVLDGLFDACFPMLDKIAVTNDALEKDVFDLVSQREMLRDILTVKKDIINFRRIILPQRALIVQLEHKVKRYIAQDLDLYFDDLVDKVEKIWNTIDNYRELINSLQDTHESLISYRTNHVIRILTVFSVIMLPLTFITGVYGMNIQGIPLSSGHMPFLSIAMVMITVAVVMLVFFRYKRWL